MFKTTKVIRTACAIHLLARGSTLSPLGGCRVPAPFAPVEGGGSRASFLPWMPSKPGAVPLVPGAGREDPVRYSSRSHARGRSGAQVQVSGSTIWTGNTSCCVCGYSPVSSSGKTTATRGPVHLDYHHKFFNYIFASFWVFCVRILILLSKSSRLTQCVPSV